MSAEDSEEAQVKSHLYLHPSPLFPPSLTPSQSISVVHQRGRGLAWRIWPGAHILSDFLLKNGQELIQGKRVVEVGAGVGLVGMVCGGMGAKKVCISDLGEVVPALQRTIDSNQEEVRKRVIAREIGFGVEKDAKNALNDLYDDNKRELDFLNPAEFEDLVVVGSDLVYWESLQAPLAESLRFLCCELKADCYMGYTKRNWKLEKRFFTKILKQYGLEVELLLQGRYQEKDATSQEADSSVVLDLDDDENWNARVYKIRGVERGGEEKEWKWKRKEKKNDREEEEEKGKKHEKKRDSVEEEEEREAMEKERRRNEKKKKEEEEKKGKAKKKGKQFEEEEDYEIEKKEAPKLSARDKKELRKNEAKYKGGQGRKRG